MSIPIGRQNRKVWGWLMFRSLGKQVLTSYSLSLGSRFFTRKRIRRKALMPQEGNSKKMQEKTEALGIFREREIEPGRGNEYLLVHGGHWVLDMTCGPE